MIRTAIALAIISVLAITAQGQLTVTMDAADRNLDGDVIEPHIRLTADNSNGTENLTNVFFYPEIHGGILEQGRLVHWGDSNNPWDGARPAGWRSTHDNISYEAGMSFYGRDCWFSPFFLCEYLPEHPDYTTPPDGLEGDLLQIWQWQNNFFELRGEVPVGINWDFAVRLTGSDGTVVDLFSVAGGDLETDQGFFHVSDADRSPQSVPEPATMTMIGIGAIALSALRKKNNGV